MYLRSNQKWRVSKQMNMFGENIASQLIRKSRVLSNNTSGIFYEYNACFLGSELHSDMIAIFEFNNTRAIIQ